MPTRRIHTPDQPQSRTPERRLAGGVLGVVLAVLCWTALLAPLPAAAAAQEAPTLTTEALYTGHAVLPGWNTIAPPATENHTRKGGPAAPGAGEVSARSRRPSAAAQAPSPPHPAHLGGASRSLLQVYRL